jgi:pyruvate kinase
MNIPRRCKIIATIGPASNPYQLLQAGATAFRLNFSHGEHETQRQSLESIRKAEAQLGLHVPIVADLQGPKIRVSRFENGSIELKFNQTVTLECSHEKGREGHICLPHLEIFAVIEVGDVLKLDDGTLSLTIIEKTNTTHAIARVDVGGMLSDHKGVNLPQRVLPIPALTEKDRADLQFALEIGVDIIALSFVQTPEDVAEAQKMVAGRAQILSKIEKPQALEQIEAIAALSDMIMVARGDLGVELPMEQVPIAQRKIVQTCRRLGKPVVVATQMLQSMVDAPVPTRAEASDVATAVYMGADAVMLSAESAVGKHPATAVAMMDRLIRAVEADEHFWNTMHGGRKKVSSKPANALAAAARDIARQLKACAIFAFTRTGNTARITARERPTSPIYAHTPDIKAARALSLVWGVTSVLSPDLDSSDAMFSWAEQWSRDTLALPKHAQIVTLAGTPFGVAGSTNLLRVIEL